MLIANPRAGSVSPLKKEVIVKALQADFKLEVADTEAREHATEIAEEALDRDFDAVVVFGGDGTINEVAQPLVGTDVALGVLPGGNTNVMARSIGVPNDPIEATAFVSASLRADRRRRIGVGRMNTRYFLFSCGIGLDAEVVRRVEESAARTGRKSEWTFVRHALAAGSTEYRTSHQWLTIRVEGEEPFRGVLGIACNGWPLTYFKRFPVDACPQASLDGALDMLMLRNIRTTTIPRIVWSVFVSRSHVGWRKARYFHDVRRVEWEADEPRPLQVDGDYIGLVERAVLTHHPDALDLLT
jgi:diacylglycerol kinase family enzyme